MTDRESGEHLAPQTFIDLVEGAPVEASRRLHLEACERCRDELEELGRTLALVRTAEELDATGVVGVGTTQARGKGLGLWLVAAAAILVALLISYPRVRPLGFLPERDETASVPERLLPPAEDDEAFQALLTLANQLEAAEAVAGQDDEGSNLVPGEIDELTPEERGILLERLAEEMRSSS